MSDDLATLAAEYDAEHGVAEPEAVTQEGEAPETSETVEETPELGIFDKVLDSYGGDKEALAQAWIENQNSMSRLFQEVEVLKRKLPVEEEVPLTSPDLVSLDEEAKEYTSQATELGQAQVQLVNEFQAENAELNKLKGQLEYADDEKKDNIKSQIKNAERRLVDLNQLYRQNEVNAKLLQGKIKDLTRQRKSVTEDLRKSKDAERGEAEELQRIVEGTNAAFNSELTKVLGEFVAEKHRWVSNYVRAELGTLISKHSGPMTEVEIKSAIRTIGKELKSERPEIVTSKQKAKVTPPATMKTVVSENSGVQAPPPDKAKDPNYWRQRAKVLMAGRR